MKVELKERTEDHVRTYFERTRNAEIQAMIPQSANTLDEALENYHKTLDRHATSYGKTVHVDGIYVGDIWCYGISKSEIPQAMVSYCIFEKSIWNKGFATEALAQFLEEIKVNLFIDSVGAFTYSGNRASIRVLEKNGFTECETFSEDGVESKFFLKGITDCHTSLRTGSQ